MIGWKLVFASGHNLKKTRSKFLLLEKTLPPTPSISSFSSVKDSDVDAVL